MAQPLFAFRQSGEATFRLRSRRLSPDRGPRAQRAVLRCERMEAIRHRQRLEFFAWRRSGASIRFGYADTTLKLGSTYYCSVTRFLLLQREATCRARIRHCALGVRISPTTSIWQFGSRGFVGSQRRSGADRVRVGAALRRSSTCRRQVLRRLHQARFVRTRVRRYWNGIGLVGSRKFMNRSGSERELPPSAHQQG